ncbi:ABC transporter substrate-binding protein [Amycolatopsis acidicola]|uniref:ABC transporter substrate-binding protein n=1 Tax=Amycolatopsis acidicola TaxID=2596893 RepID=A0A5N0VFZ8_9PSEU|nr:ABC transporter substrate-binding protein [Amycolatopsis acidicola]KAA9164364.1 ABC transporter substrate-binding protein [Amycolatopsis acidicola]
MKRKIRWGLLPLATVVSVAAAGCAGGGDAATGGDGNTYQVLLLAPLSGPLASYGKAVQVGGEAAADVINAHGGIGGRQVHVSVKDDKGDSTEVASLTQAAMADTAVPNLVVAGLTSDEAVTALTVTQPAGVLASGPPVSTSLADFKLYMSPTPRAADGADATLAKLASQGHKKVGLVVTDDEAGQAIATYYQSIGAAHGVSIVGVEKVAADSADATAQLERLRADGPDVVVASMFGPSAGVVVRSHTKLGWNVPLYGDVTFAANNIVKQVGQAEAGSLTVIAPAYLVKGSPVGDSPAMQAAVAAMDARNGGPLAEPMQAYVHTYMGLILVKYAVEKAGTTDGQRVYDARTQLKATDMPLYAGSQSVFEDGSNWPAFKPDDFIALRTSGSDNGFIVSQP